MNDVPTPEAAGGSAGVTAAAAPKFGLDPGLAHHFSQPPRGPGKAQTKLTSGGASVLRYRAGEYSWAAQT